MEGAGQPDATRREILDPLRAGPKTTGWLDGRLTTLSRYAVMQHLGVLVDAGLVLVRREGRYRYDYLNAVPLRDLYERRVVAGPISEEEAVSIGDHGDLKRFEEALRRIIEGERTPNSETGGAS